MLVAPDEPRYADLGMRERAIARMLFYTLWDDGGGFSTYDDGLGHLRGYQFVCREIRQVVKLGVPASKHAAKSLGAGLQHIPLLSHATYRREEVSGGAAVRLARTGQECAPPRGSCVVPGDVHRCLLCHPEQGRQEVLGDHDVQGLRHQPGPVLLGVPEFGVSHEPTGRPYLDKVSHDSRILIFTRDTADEAGLTVPYTCLGQVDYAQHSGEKSIAITWKLHRPMPADVYATAAAMAQ